MTVELLRRGAHRINISFGDLASFAFSLYLADPMKYREVKTASFYSFHALLHYRSKREDLIPIIKDALEGQARMYEKKFEVVV